MREVLRIGASRSLKVMSPSPEGRHWKVVLRRWTNDCKAVMP